MFVAFCFLLRATLAIGGSASEVAALSILIGKFPNNVGAVTGARATSYGVGLSLGPALGGFLYSVGGFTAPFTVIGCVMIFTTPWVFLFLRRTEKQTDEKTAEESTTIFKALRIPGTFISALSFAVSGCSFGYTEPIFEPYMIQLGESTVNIGLMFLLFSGVFTLSAAAVTSIVDKTKRYRGFLILGFTSFGIGYLMLGPAPFLTFLPQRNVLLVCISLAVAGLGGGISLAPIMPDLIRTARKGGMPDNLSSNAALSSIFGSMFYLGATIGPSIAGVTDEHLGFQWSTSIAGFICVAHALLLLIFTVFKPISDWVRDNNSGLAEEEEKPMLGNSRS
ncbi:MFS-type transporter SLC18B1-like [Porites lutea]